MSRALGIAAVLFVFVSIIFFTGCGGNIVASKALAPAERSLAGAPPAVVGPGAGSFALADAPLPTVRTRILSFRATPATIKKNGFTTLAWETSNATAVALTPVSGIVDGQSLPTSGRKTEVPAETTTYTLTATGPGGIATATVTVNVIFPPPAILQFTASPATVKKGAFTTLSWRTSQATKVSISPGSEREDGQPLPITGRTTGVPLATTTYTLTATGPGGSTTASVTVTVTSTTTSGASPMQTAAMSATPSATATTTSSDTTLTLTRPTRPDPPPYQPSPAPPPSGSLSSIKHIIFWAQENRSFDNYFGMLGRYRASKGLPYEVDGLDSSAVTPQYDDNGTLVYPYHQSTVCAENTSPSWNPSWYSYDQGAMDNFVHARDTITSIDPYYHRTMAYYTERELPYYYELATQFATSDRFFSGLMSSTIPNRMYLFAATSQGHISPDPPPSGGFPMRTIFENLRDAGISWRYYYMDNSIFLAQFEAWNDPAITDNVRNIDEYFSILADPNADNLLPQVIFIERGADTGLDEHPDNNTQVGAAKAADIINALLHSAAWPSSVFIHTYDEFGGLYDHVPPISVPAPDDYQPIASPGEPAPLAGDFAHSGFRLPVIVISPWVKPNYVSHTPMDITAILKFIETRFNLPALTRRDAAANNMLDFFDFTSPHRLNVPPLPSQPTSGTCDMNQELQ